MAQQNEDLSPHELRFERIEAALETLAADSHKAFENLNSMQSFLLDENIRLSKRMDKRDDDIEALFKASEALFKVTGALADGQKQLLTAQVLMAEAQAKSEQHIAALAIAQAETQGKLDALIHMWAEMIRDRGKKNGGPTPPPAT
jgi:hypothetical protein